MKGIPEIMNRSLFNIISCGLLKEGENVLIISDIFTKNIGERMEELIKQKGNIVRHSIIPTLKNHGQEPPDETASLMLKNDVVYCLSSYSLAHSDARFQASQKGVRFVSLPNYSEELLMRKSLLTDFHFLTNESLLLAALLDCGNKVQIKSAAGTDLLLNITGRKANACPGWCFAPGVIASPPDAETNIAPVETDSNGVLVVDGSIPCAKIGLLKKPVRLEIAKGVVNNISGEKSEILDDMFSKTGTPASRIIAEFGIGLNPLAGICGIMLEDEGCRGTIHIGIGSNSTIGGLNKVAFHLDHIIKAPTVWVDDVMIIDSGDIIKVER